MSSFLRVGAATRCPACGHIWRISASHIHRLEDRPEAPEPAIHEDPPPADPRSDSSVTGMSGLSDLMQAEPNAPAVPGAAPPIQEAKFASPEAAQKLARSAANLRQTQQPTAMSHESRRMAILIIAVLALGVAMAGIGLAVLGGDKSDLPDIPGPDASAQPSDPALENAGPPAQPRSTDGDSSGAR
ncbi:MAG: hypothetical protein AAGA25_14065 [Planctomycetota bacterium]